MTRQSPAPRWNEEKVTPSRAAALDALFSVQEGMGADEALEDAFHKRRNISSADKAYAMELTYGTLRWRRRLDDLLAKHVKKTLPEPPLLDVIRVAAYQLLFGGRAHAAVSTAVEAARATKGEEAAAKFANAVLRGATEGARMAATQGRPDLSRGRLGAWWSFPEWLVDAFEEVAGKEGLSALLEASNERPPLTLRAVPGTRDAVIASLGPTAHAGVHAKDAIVIDEPRGKVDELSGFREGKFTVQDEGAQLITELLGDLRGKELLDTCAAPGGKAIHAAQLGAKVTAIDASEKRLKRATEAAVRLGTPIAVRTAEVTREGIRELEGRVFSHVLVDAPCSATGIIRRKPDVKWARAAKDVARLAERQADILEGALSHLAPGGRLVYAVCSLLRAEGEGVVEPFLERHPELTVVAPPKDFADGRFFRSRPDKHGTDGFFAAILARKR